MPRIIKLSDHVQSVLNTLKALSGTKREDIPVAMIPFSTRVANCLGAAGITTLGHLTRQTEAEMLKTKNFGRDSLREVKLVLRELNLDVGMNLPGYQPYLFDGPVKPRRGAKVTVKTVKCKFVPHRLFVATGGDGETVFLTAANLNIATTLLGDTAREPTKADVTEFWTINDLSSKTSKEIAKKFNVTKNTVTMWAELAGQTAMNNRARRELIEKMVLEGKTTAQIVKALGVVSQTVKNTAKKIGVEVAKASRRKMPSEEALLGLAPGKTWQQVADACGVSVGSLRTYVYGRKEFGEKFRALLVKADRGTRSHGQIHVPTLVDMFKSGMNSYQISAEFRVSQAAVQYWLRKEGLLAASEG